MKQKANGKKELKAPPKTVVDTTLQTMAGQAAASNDSLLARVRKEKMSDDVRDLADRFESAMIMVAKPQKFYRDQFETISETSHDPDEQAAADED
jgi:hypothetical protein